MVKLKPKQKEQIEKQIKAYESKTSTELIKIPIGSDELDLEVDPYVANPNIMNSGIQLVNYLFEHPELVKDKIVTDMGTGCGIIGIAAAKMGAKKVFMIDIDAKAVKNAQRNVERHKVGNICTIITSDLFKNINEDTKSHTHIFNHPFFAGEPIRKNLHCRTLL